MPRRSGSPGLAPSTLPAVSDSAELDRAFSLHVDENVVVVRWMPGVEITGPLASAAMATVDKLNGDHKRPLLVDMTGTANVTRDARGAFSRECQVSRMALVGRSAVDRMIVNFALKVSRIAIPSRFFTSLPVAMAWLREHEPMDV
jgi:hypothetical protein